MNILEEQRRKIRQHFESISEEQLNKNLEKCGINDLKFNFKSEILNLYPSDFSIDMNLESYTEHLMAQIINTENNFVKEAIIDYAKKYANEKKEPVRLMLLDENQVRLIINLGIDEYIRRYKNGSMESNTNSK